MESKPNIILQLKDYLVNNYRIRKNLDTGWVEVNDKNMDIIVFNSLFIDCKTIFQKTNKGVLKCILNSDFVDTYNPRKRP